MSKVFIALAVLGNGRPLFQSLPELVRLRQVEAVPAHRVTHLHYQVIS